MGIISGKGVLVTFMESEVTCPICTFAFDASAKIEKAKYPTFNSKCPACKGKITISTPIFGGTLKCWETDVPKCVERQETETPIQIITAK